jgi:integrase
LEQLRRNLGDVKVRHLDRARLIQFGRDRAKQGAGGVTLSIDLTFIKTILVDAAAIHGIALSTEPVLLARTALKRLGLIKKGQERDRRPTAEELEDVLDYLDKNARCTFPMGRLVRFAIASAMRLDEICNIVWEDLNPKHRIVLVRNRKDPRHKEGNDQKVPLLDLPGSMDGLALAMAVRDRWPPIAIIITSGRVRRMPSRTAWPMLPSLTLRRN